MKYLVRLEGRQSVFWTLHEFRLSRGKRPRSGPSKILSKTRNKLLVFLLEMAWRKENIWKIGHLLGGQEVQKVLGLL